MEFLPIIAVIAFGSLLFALLYGVLSSLKKENKIIRNNNVEEKRTHALKSNNANNLRNLANINLAVTFVSLSLIFIFSFIYIIQFAEESFMFIIILLSGIAVVLLNAFTLFYLLKTVCDIYDRQN